LRLDERLAGFAVKGLCKFGMFVTTPLTRSRVGECGFNDCVQSQRRRARHSSTPIVRSHKEALLGREVVGSRKLHRAVCSCHRHPRQELAAKIGDILARGQRAVDLQVINNDVLEY